jgi:hypothetical protein
VQANIKSFQQKFYYLFFLLIFISSASDLRAEELSKTNSGKELSTIDSILGALADMTVDQAKEMLNLAFTRDLREKVCGFDPFRYHATKIIPTNILFNHTCNYVKDKIESNVVSEELIIAFKSDLITNGLLLSINNNDKSFETLTAFRDAFNKDILSIDVVNQGNEKIALLVRLFNQLWEGVPVKQALYSALSESNNYEPYIKFLDLAALATNVIRKNNKAIQDFEIELEPDPMGTPKVIVQIVYFKLKPDGSGIEPVKESFTIDTKGLNKDIATNLLQILTLDQPDKYILRLSANLLAKYGCNESPSCRITLNSLINNKPREVLAVLSKTLKESENDPEDTASSHGRVLKALKTISSMAELTNVDSRESARSILDNYLADANTRTSNYWEHSISLGTLFGVATGRSYCKKCTTQKETLTPNLFMPFGFLYTYSYYGIQLHIFDLGQYTSIVENQNEDEDTSVRDALAPGVSIILARKRRYPVSLGLDYTYLPSNGKTRSSAHQTKFFVAMDIPLFKIY